jgi:VWFA-related protein
MSPWLLTSLLLAAASDQTPPTFSAESHTVSVDVSVSRRGKPVTDLAAADFELRDDGVRQTVTLANLEQLPLCVMLAFDTSSSSEPKLGDLKAAAHALLKGLKPGDEAGLLTFSHRLRLLARPTTDLAAVHDALDRIRTSGATSVFDALYAALKLPTPGRRALVVLFSDGEDNMSFLSPSQLQAVAARANVLLAVVGLRQAQVPGTPAVWTETNGARVLRGLAESTGGDVWWADSSARLPETFERVLSAMKTRYVLQYDPADVARAGMHRLDVRVKRPGMDVRARRSYSVPR